jgi:hypothetical protein
MQAGYTCMPAAILSHTPTEITAGSERGEIRFFSIVPSHKSKKAFFCFLIDKTMK